MVFRETRQSVTVIPRSPSSCSYFRNTLSIEAKFKKNCKMQCAYYCLTIPNWAINGTQAEFDQPQTRESQHVTLALPSSGSRNALEAAQHLVPTVYMCQCRACPGLVRKMYITFYIQVVRKLPWDPNSLYSSHNVPGLTEDTRKVPLHRYDFQANFP